MLLFLLACLLLQNVINAYLSHSFEGRGLRKLKISSKPDNYIDAEIVGDENKLQKYESSPKKSNPIVNKFLELIGQDDASKEKKKRNEAMNTMIDKAFEGTGLIGGAVKGIFKGVANMVADGMTTAMGDISLVQDAVKEKLEQSRLLSSEAKNFLSSKSVNKHFCISFIFSSVISTFGSVISCGPPMQTMTSSININGNVKKSLNLVIPIQGSSSGGFARVVAEIDSTGEVQLQQLVVQTNDGRSINVSGGEGGRQSSRVIDTEQII